MDSGRGPGLIPVARRMSGAFALVVLGFLGASPPAEAQAGGVRELPLEPIRASAAPVPFGPGETAEYQVKMGMFNVGTGHMTVHGVERVRGHSTYHVSMGVSGGRLGLRVNNLYQSWMDIRTLASRRFIQDQHEIRTQRVRHFEIYPEEGRYERMDVEDSGKLITDVPLDDISFVYYARTLPLEVGDVYTLEQYFREERNPVVLQVLRREEVTVPAGTFQTIVIRPILQAGGLFGEGGEAEVYLTDDEHRIMIMMRARVPVLRSITLLLTDVRMGRPLRALNSPGGLPDDDGS